MRNLDGELISIPNGSIQTVRNLTKDWSRVNFEIVIAYNSDISQAMKVIKQVAGDMQAETDWADLFLEPISILGIDEVAHTGIKIRAIIKTQPLQQWAVGRELRYRVKQAFDQQEIQIGVPQQTLQVQSTEPLLHFPNPHQNHYPPSMNER